jgi:hypothetical protein
VDRGIIEVFGPFGIAYKVYSQGKLNSLFQTGFIYHYLFVMLVGISIVVLFTLFLLLFY